MLETQTWMVVSNEKRGEVMADGLDGNLLALTEEHARNVCTE